ncbi:hypothetical protein HHI36_015118 [Cryptolaemus montrouzieri]|uniref:Uncharacterized protein n=1 Tax=Cryptolaemus montrouzieri TaxID=559131 RepID=A0ABD2N4N5_9CUCU
MECKHCKKAQTKENALVACDRCNICICKALAGLTSSEIEVFKLKQERLMIYRSKSYLKNDTFHILHRIIDDKDGLISSNDEIIELLENEVNILRVDKEKIEKETPLDHLGRIEVSLLYSLFD